MLKFAARNLVSRPARSLLSLLGLTVAIVGMVGLFSVAEGIDLMVSDTLGRIPGVIVMQQGAPIPLFSRVPTKWGDEIRELDGVNVVNEEIWTRVHVINGKRIISPPRLFFGVDIEARLRLRHSIYRESMLKEKGGMFLSLKDRGTMNAVVSEQIAEEFEKAVGDTLKVNGHEITIVGIYNCGSLLLDVAIIMDIKQIRRITRFSEDSVCSFYVEPEEGVDVDRLTNRIRDLFRGRDLDSWNPSSALATAGVGLQIPIVDFLSMIPEGFRAFIPEKSNSNDADSNGADKKSTGAISPKKKTPTRAPSNAEEKPGRYGRVDENVPLEISSASEWSERAEEFTADLDIFLLIMTGIGVTIAVLSIINTMLMSVSERIIEFGILKANGWSRSDVMKLITFESAILGVGGGVLGCLFGWIGTLVINWKWPEHVSLYASPGLLVFSLAFSTALGILGGLYPAIWATRMMPMDAIRRG